MSISTFHTNGHTKQTPPRSVSEVRHLWKLALILTIAVWTSIGTIREANALAGFHGLPVSSWDTSVSTVALTGHGAIFESGRLVMVGYGSNFSAKRGNLSAQFKINYINYLIDDMDSASHGLSGSAIALVGIPFGEKYEHGLARMAFNFYVGAAPSALINGLNNHISIPLVLGIGMQFSPIKYLSIIPWIEASPMFNAATIFNGIEDTGEESEDITDEIEKAMGFEYSFDVRLRGALSLTIHMGNHVDLQVDVIASHIGESFEGPVAVFVGGGLVFVWDNPKSQCEYQ